MKNLLFLNACIRPQELSRTEALCRSFLDALPAGQYAVTEKKLESIPLDAFDAAALAQRDALCKQGQFSHPSFALAHEFAAADALLVGAPFWDLSFPAKLKIYLEHVCVAGITFQYCETGFDSLCHAKKLLYITTAGGALGEDNLGYTYVQRLCTRAFGVPEAACLAAENLDDDQFQPAAIMEEAHQKARALAAVW